MDKAFFIIKTTATTTAIVAISCFCGTRVREANVNLLYCKWIRDDRNKPKKKKKGEKDYMICGVAE
jgi:hypothetical protein